MSAAAEDELADYEEEEEEVVEGKADDAKDVKK
jgi:hypothetical protein